MKNKKGKIVSKELSAKAKKSPWIAACWAARAVLKIKGFTVIKKGTQLYKQAKLFHEADAADQLILSKLFHRSSAKSEQLMPLIS